MIYRDGKNIGGNPNPIKSQPGGVSHAPVKDWRKIKPPGRLLARPRDVRGFVIPYSVDDGTDAPDFRLTQPARVRELLTTGNCWICGQKRDGTMTFIGGPLSIVNHLFTDGWMHWACAVYSLRVCPFLARPQAEYSQRAIPDGIRVNPNVAPTRPDEFGLAFVSIYSTLVDASGGLIIKAGRYKRVQWFSHYGVLLRSGSGQQAQLRSTLEHKRWPEKSPSTPRVHAFRERKRAAKAAAAAQEASG